MPLDPLSFCRSVHIVVRSAFFNLQVHLTAGTCVSNTKQMTETISSPTGVSSSSQSSNQDGHQLGVPIAIVLAGGLIAAAVYFGGGTSKSVQLAASPVPDEGVAAVPTEPPIGPFRPVSATDHVRGAVNAKVTIIEYSDLECPFCQRFHPTLQQVLAEYPNDVRWVYRHAPLEQLHSKAPKEAEATECADEQGKFWELTDKIYKVTPTNNGLDLATLPQLAASVGVKDIPAFESCLASGRYAGVVADDLADAQSAGMRGTPYAIVVNEEGEQLPINGAQPYSAVKAAIDQLL